MSIYITAKRYIDAGLSVIPIVADGTKRPRVVWDPYKDRLATDDELRSWFAGTAAGIAIVGGIVSGNLERIDFDHPGIYDEWRDLCRACGYEDLESRLVLVRTPRHQDCYHLYYRCEDEVEGNQPLARRQVGTDERGRPIIKAIIETRGEGGYTLAPGSPAQCHDTGREYELVRGDLTQIPVLTVDQREALLEMARSFNAYVPAERTRGTVAAEGDTSRPGDDYNARGPWRDALTAVGWTCAGRRGEVEYWRRPGKKRGISATWNYLDSQTLYVFSSNATPLEVNASYTPFGLVTTLEYSGDYGAATRALGKQGYGEPLKTASIVSSGRATAPTTTGEPPKEPEDSQLARLAFTDLGNAERFLARYMATVRFCPAFAKWFVWDGMRWAEDEAGSVVQLGAQTVRKMLDEADYLPAEPLEGSRKALRDVLREHARKSESDGKIGSMLNLARAWLGIRSDDLDSDPWLLNCKNGTLDLRNMQLLQHRQDNLITKLAPWNYDPAAECPTWLNFLDSIFEGNAHLISYLQRAIGYALTGVIREQCLFFLHGQGSNGKSTFLNAIQAVLGDYARDTPTESLMVKSNEGISNDIARLKGARFVTAVEAEADKRMAESLVKRLTGGDTITARFMRAEFFQFRGTFKIFLGANHKPGVRGTDDGIWRRIKLIPFLVRIPDSKQDRELDDKLRAEAEGILAWAVRGCKEWQKHGLGEPEEVTAATAAYRDEMDFLGPFLADKCTLGPTLSIKAGDLYKSYTSYCEDNKEKPLSNTRFGRMIMERPGIKRKRHSTGNGMEYWGLDLSEWCSSLFSDNVNESEEDSTLQFLHGSHAQLHGSVGLTVLSPMMKKDSNTHVGLIGVNPTEPYNPTDASKSNEQDLNTDFDSETEEIL